MRCRLFFFFFQAEDGIRDKLVTGVQTCALPIYADVRGTISALPELCAAGATVIWTRTRRAPDLTPAVRRWLGAAGFAEQAFHAPAGELFSVGVHRFTGAPRPMTPRGRLFRFLA